VTLHNGSSCPDKYSVSFIERFRMFKFFLLTALIMGHFMSSAYAEPCVKVRNGNDGYDCMKFSSEEKKRAAKYGLRLGMPYKAVKRELSRNGWIIDQDWLREEESIYSRKDGLVCGHGWDAICWSVYIKGQEKISMSFSGTNDGYPLTDVDKER
jgi:hypothetical protein